MDEKLNQNNIQNDDSTQNTEDSDYKKLINRLKEMSKTIGLLEKHYLDNF